MDSRNEGPGLAQRSPYALRHTYATWSIAAGVELYTLAVAPSAEGARFSTLFGAAPASGKCVFRVIAIQPWLTLVHAVAKNAAMAVPGARRARKRRLLARGLSVQTTPHRAEKIFQRHAAAAAAVRPIEQADVLEIGPGGSLSVLKLFRASGARRATSIDVLPWVAPGTTEEDPAVEYLYPVTVEDLPFRDESFDIIYSQGCLPMVGDPESAIGEIARVLRRGGVTTHFIDLRDPSRLDRADPLRFLRYRDWQWRLAYSHRLFKFNRWRASDFLEAFRRHGFETGLEVTATVDVDDAYRSTFAPRFRGKSLHDLATVAAFVVARKVT